MPYNPGGEATRLLETYKQGEDAFVTFAEGRFLAQTFTHYNDFHLYKLVPKALTTWEKEPLYCSIRSTDSTGKPLPTSIATVDKLFQRSRAKGFGLWEPFTFKDFPLITAGTSAIILSYPVAPFLHDASWRCDQTNPTYTLGKSWLSDDWGLTWTEIADTDFYFEVWGYNAPQPTPPPPTISNWAVTNINFLNLTDGYALQITTDTPCHLYMRWTHIEPEEHIIPRLRRGIALHDDKRFCFVVWHENEQLESGDTLIHTFIKRPWEICETRWFYFVGTVVRDQVPSTSPIFKKHRTEAGEPWVKGMLFEDQFTSSPDPAPVTLVFNEPWTT